MGPLFLVNWHRVNLHFRGLMWLVACALAIVILIQAAPPAKPSHRPPRGLSALIGAHSPKP